MATTAVDMVARKLSFRHADRVEMHGKEQARQRAERRADGAAEQAREPGVGDDQGPEPFARACANRTPCRTKARWRCRACSSGSAAKGQSTLCRGDRVRGWSLPRRG